MSGYIGKYLHGVSYLYNARGGGLSRIIMIDQTFSQNQVAYLGRRNKKINIENESIWSNQEIPKFFPKKIDLVPVFCAIFCF